MLNIHVTSQPLVKNSTWVVDARDPFPDVFHRPAIINPFFALNPAHEKLFEKCMTEVAASVYLVRFVGEVVGVHVPMARI